MQEMTSAICNSKASIGDEGRLEDTRDGKIYWIAKLRDGNCWMTQNLDLDLSTSKPLTSADSDVTNNWTPTNSTQTTAAPSFTASTNDAQSWDSGIRICNASNGCSEPVNGDYDSHYLVGNYYSWGAATAGQAATLTSTTAGEQSTQSICPKGWMLPTGGADDGQYNTLMSGLTVAQITTSPYYFVYGGVVSNSSLYNAGSYGYYWSSTANNASYAYALYFTTSVLPSYTLTRYSGASVRCVAK